MWPWWAEYVAPVYFGATVFAVMLLGQALTKMLITDGKGE